MPSLKFHYRMLLLQPQVTGKVANAGNLVSRATRRDLMTSCVRALFYHPASHRQLSGGLNCLALLYSLYPQVSASS
jgi:hypothetical protein